jgi:hypothetical protein
MALRDNTEIFGKDLWKFLEMVGEIPPSDTQRQGFQLMKFDRLSPDVFAWLLRDEKTYLVTLSDRPGDHPSNQFLADDWLKGKISSDQFRTLYDNDNSMYLDNNIDTVIIRRLPDDFDLDMDDLYDET